MNREELKKLFDEALKLSREEKWDASIAKWDEVIPLLDGGSKANAYTNRGNTKDGMGDHEGAIADYTQALVINPQSTSAYTNRGNTKRLIGDYAGSIADHDRAIAIDPQFADAYNNRGNTKDNRGDHKDAVADYDQAIAINPQYATAYCNRGDTKRKMDDHAGAIADLDRAIAIDSQLAEHITTAARPNAQWATTRTLSPTMTERLQSTRNSRMRITTAVTPKTTLATA